MRKLSKSFSYINIGEYMKIEVMSKECFSIFINRLYFSMIDYSDREQLVEHVKKILKKMKSRLNLRGFYKIKVFVHEKVGIFLDAIKLEDLDYSNALDLRVIVFLDEKIYFETEDYFVIEHIPGIRYYRNKYYCLVDDIDNLYEILEFGKFIYGEEVVQMLNHSVAL